MLFEPGFYLAGRAIPLPKLVAVPLTLGLFTLLTYLALSKVEKTYRAYLRRQHKSPERKQSHHTIFTLVTIFSFWFFFTFGGRPILNAQPAVVGLGFNAIVLIAGSIWGYRTLERTHAQYLAELAQPSAITEPMAVAEDTRSDFQSNSATVTTSSNRSIPTHTPTSSTSGNRSSLPTHTPTSSTSGNRSPSPTLTPNSISKSVKPVGVASLQENRKINLDATQTRPKS
jgi:uncharacterized membrane protein YgcG